MKQLIERLIQLRNPGFSFHQAVTYRGLICFVLAQGICYLRGLRLLLLFRKPKGALLGAGVRFYHLSDIRYGRWLKLGHQVTLSALGTAGISMGDRVGIGDYGRVIVSTSLQHPGQGITIGDRVGIGEFAYLGGGGGLFIGADCIIGQYFSCHPENHHFDAIDVSIRLQGVSRKGIHIGQNCWIGSKVTVLDGVTIGEGSVVAAGSVVHSSFPPGSVIGGVPARLLKSRYHAS